MKKHLHLIIGLCLVAGLMPGCSAEAVSGAGGGGITLTPSTIVFANGTSISMKYEGGTYVNPVSGEGDGSITYSSSTTSVATIHASTGVVTITGIGTSTISATKAETATHSEITGTYNLSIESWVLGDTGPSGEGTVFYVASDGMHGLEAAPKSWFDLLITDRTDRWRSADDGSNATSIAVGTGYNNTYSVLSGSNFPAAGWCRNYDGGGLTDWFLPSRDELNLLCLNRSYLDGYQNNSYLSSSQSDNYNVHGYNFQTGNYVTLPKLTSYFIRPVRAF